MTRFLVRTLLVLLLLLVALPLLVLLTFESERGSAWLLYRTLPLVQAADRELSVGSIQGRLLGQLQLHDVHYVGEGVQVDAEQLQLSWRPSLLWDRRLVIAELALQGAQIHLTMSDRQPEEPTQAVAAAIPDINIPLSISLQRLLLRDVRILGEGFDWQLQQASLSAQADAQQLSVRDLRLRGEGVDLSGEIGMRAQAPHALQGELVAVVGERWTGPDVGEVDARLQASGPALQPSIDLRLAEPAMLQVSGDLDLKQSQPGFDLRAQWPSLGWPLHGSQQYRLDQGKLGIQGNPQDYRVELDAMAQVAPEVLQSASGSPASLPPVQLRLRAAGDSRQARIETLRLTPGEGELAVEGRVGWGEAIEWDLQAGIRKFNPGLLAPDWPGVIDGSLSSSGSYQAGAEQLKLNLRLQEVRGRLRDQLLRLSGDVKGDGKTWQVDGLSLQSGDNKLQAQGRLGDVLALSFGLDAPRLAALYPGLSGSLVAAGQLDGSLDRPRAKVRVDGRELALGQDRLKTLDADIDWTEQGGKVAVLAKGIAAGGQSISQLQLDLEGLPERHTLGLDAQSSQLNLAMRAQGGIEDGGDNPGWRGELRQMVLGETLIGDWQLAAPVQLSVASPRVSASELCLQQSQGPGHSNACVTGAWDQAKGLDLRGSLERFPLDLLDVLLPAYTQLQGELQGSFSVRGDPTMPQASLELVPGDGALVLGTDQPEPLRIGFSQGRLQADLGQDRGELQLHLGLPPSGSLTAKVDLGAVGQGGDRTLGGRLQADFPDLALVEGFVPDLSGVKGHLRMDAKLDGSLHKPGVRGGLYVDKASAQLPSAGLALEQIELAVTGTDDGPLKVQGQVSSGGGLLRLGGMVDPSKPGKLLDLSIKGSDFLAYRTPDARVWVSPALRLQGADRLRLTGTLRIPQARIEIKDLPGSTVAVSEDTVIVGSDGSEQRNPRSLEARLRLELGEQVQFKGFGLSTRLSGALDANVDRNRERVEGRIELVDGTYKAYGQDLTIERGRLLFSGVAANPDIDLRAYRVSRDETVKAYLTLSGPLREPRPRVFSEPALPDSEALAYLLTGRALDSAGSGDGLNIATAAVSLGISRSEPLLVRMSERLGLDDLHIEGGENGYQDTSLIVGKYLNPDLYLGYSQHLFEPEGAVLLRLRLNSNFDVESKSGVEQSVDLLFKHEHD